MTTRGTLRDFLTSFLAGTLLAMAPAVSLSADPPTALETRRVALPDTPATGNPYGQIRFRGMVELPGVVVDGMRLSQLSDLAWDEDDGILYAVSDKGALFWLEPVIEEGTLVDVRLLRAVRLGELPPATAQPGAQRAPLRGGRFDAEGLDILHGHNGVRGDAELLISFERYPRITGYTNNGVALRDYPLPVPLRERGRYKNSNKMLEAVCVSPALGILTAPEAPLRSEPEGYTRLFGLNGESWRYPLKNGNHIVSMVALDDAGALVLEREFIFAVGRSIITLKKIVKFPDAAGSAPVRAQTVAVMDSNDGFLIANFEGLTRHHGNRYFMVSDNNDIFLQQTLLLYFELPGE